MSNGKLALITGGSRGLGKNTAMALARSGVDIILTYRTNESEAREVVSNIQSLGRKAVCLQLDVGQIPQFGTFAEKIASHLKDEWQCSRFDFLVNNAGRGVHKPFMETTEADFDQLLNEHFKGVFFLTQTLLPLMADGGRIINISSGLTRFSVPGHSAYASFKGAIEILSRYLAKELGSRGIRVNAFAPGAIETDFSGGVVRDNAEMNQHLASQTALGRVGLPDDIGGAIASLLSDQNGWITGQRIEASGGMFL
ncbi:SDR family NAD(P)-dependent oxidoreductase [Teredinibacter haidensis]|uniref:SDR family NAD(P)-dependent oxidoreductase n=1 Tax=Teredinibacter haidensis TaxID=2731755 RepID=UPI000948DCCE|nr:SDR family oxidoreductase [Teredinibacter haidensis]